MGNGSLAKKNYHKGLLYFLRPCQAVLFPTRQKAYQVWTSYSKSWPQMKPLFCLTSDVLTHASINTALDLQQKSLIIAT
jgi:hypothetical protein